MTFRGASLVDLHTHVLPGVDEGVRDAADAREALEALAAEGVLVAAATPRVRASTLAEPDAARARLAELDAAWEALREVASGGEGMPAPLRGAEVVLDAPVPDLSDPRLRLAGGDAVLVAFDGPDPPADAAARLAAVAGAGRLPVLADAARFRGLAADPEAAGSWRDAGAALQVSAGALLGRHGGEAERAAWTLLERGWADLLAGGCDGPGPGGLDAAADAVRRRGGADRAQLLVAVNPRRIARGEAPRPVPAVRERGLLGRLADLFR